MEKCWQANEDANMCSRCHEAFTLVRRRHHCRVCGMLFCDDCTQIKLLIPVDKLIKTKKRINVSKPQRCCSSCAPSLLSLQDYLRSNNKRSKDAIRNDEMEYAKSNKSLDEMLEDLKKILGNADPWFDHPCGYLSKPDFKRKAQNHSNVMKQKMFMNFVSSHKYNVRYFVLDSDQLILFYYDDEHKRHMKGFVDFAHITDVRLSDVYDAPSFSLDLVSSDRHYTLTAATQEIMLKWAYVLKKALVLKNNLLSLEMACTNDGRASIQVSMLKKRLQQPNAFEDTDIGMYDIYSQGGGESIGSNPTSLQTGIKSSMSSNPMANANSNGGSNSNNKIGNLVTVNKGGSNNLSAAKMNKAKGKDNPLAKNLVVSNKERQKSVDDSDLPLGRTKSKSLSSVQTGSSYLDLVESFTPTIDKSKAPINFYAGSTRTGEYRPQNQSRPFRRVQANNTEPKMQLDEIPEYSPPKFDDLTIKTGLSLQKDTSPQLKSVSSVNQGSKQQQTDSNDNVEVAQVSNMQSYISSQQDQQLKSIQQQASVRENPLTKIQAPVYSSDNPFAKLQINANMENPFLSKQSSNSVPTDVSVAKNQALCAPSVQTNIPIQSNSVSKSVAVSKPVSISNSSSVPLSTTTSSLKSLQPPPKIENPFLKSDSVSTTVSQTSRTIEAPTNSNFSTKYNSALSSLALLEENELIDTDDEEEDEEEERNRMATLRAATKISKSSFQTVPFSSHRQRSATDAPRPTFYKDVDASESPMNLRTLQRATVKHGQRRAPSRRFTDFSEQLEPKKGSVDDDQIPPSRPSLQFERTNSQCSEGRRSLSFSAKSAISQAYIKNSGLTMPWIQRPAAANQFKFEDGRMDSFDGNGDKKYKRQSMADLKRMAAASLTAWSPNDQLTVNAPRRR